MLVMNRLVDARIDAKLAEGGLFERGVRQVFAHLTEVRLPARIDRALCSALAADSACLGNRRRRRTGISASCTFWVAMNRRTRR